MPFLVLDLYIKTKYLFLNVNKEYILNATEKWSERAENKSLYTKYNTFKKSKGKFPLLLSLSNSLFFCYVSFVTGWFSRSAISIPRSFAVSPSIMSTIATAGKIWLTFSIGP